MSDWSAAHYDVNPGSPFDIPTAFFAQAARGKSCVIEIGARHGERITALKSLYPDIDARGLDIAKNYQTPFEAYGVRFGPFDIDETFPERSLVLSVSTLGYIEPKALQKFINRLSDKKCTLAFFEVHPWTSVKSSQPRRVNGGWYHPYDAMLKVAGFVPLVDNRWSHFESHKTLEQWTYGLYGDLDSASSGPALQPASLPASP